MKVNHDRLHGTNATRRHEARSFGHHYGAVRRHAAPERTLRVYPPLGWGVCVALPHLRRALRPGARRLDAAHLDRPPLAL